MLTVNAKGSTSRLLGIGVVAALVLICSAGGVRAQSTLGAASDLTGGYVVLPKIMVHTTGGTPAVLPGGQQYDTLIQLSNTNELDLITVDCWWVNANSHCEDTGIICESNADCVAAGVPGLNCVPGWSVNDFTVTLTAGQPLGFLASTGLLGVPCEVPPGDPPVCIGGIADGGIDGVVEDPFRGELKCVQVDENDVPVERSDLKVEATIVSTTVPGGSDPGTTTAASYNAIGFETIELGTGAAADPLCLGAAPNGSDVDCAATYAPCPAELKLNHFFEGAQTDIGGIVNTDLTLVPCSEALGDPDVQANFEVLAQMLVYNEFEQRFSTSARIECYRATTLSDIDTARGPTGDEFSIFSVGIQGTIAGQTRIRGVQGSGGPLGYGLLGVACENYREVLGGPVLATTAFNLDIRGTHEGGDAVYRTVFPDPVPPPP
jgi:hypothetical protein